LHPFAGDTNIFRKAMSDKLDRVFSLFRKRIQDEPCASKDTYLCPFLQMGSFNIHQEVNLLTRLFGYLENDIELTMSTGYFNLHENYVNLILTKSRCPLTILLASPEANGFYNGNGLSGYIPSLYVHNSQEFFKRSLITSEVPNKRKDFVMLSEYSRPNWTFHAKGIWIKSLSEKIAATVIGSSNYGYRSVYRDLEVGALLVTRNEGLIRQITEEKQALMEFCQPIEPHTFFRKDHFVPMWIRYSSRFIRHFF